MSRSRLFLTVLLAGTGLSTQPVLAQDNSPADAPAPSSSLPANSPSEASPDAADAEDVTQETFLVAWRKLPGLELAGDSLLPWLVTVCRFQAANRIRTQQRERRNTTAAADESIPSTVDVEQQVIDAEFAERILREVAGLAPLDRDIFRLCATEGYAYQAAAEELGVAHGVVRNRLSRIRTRLRTVAKEST